MGAQVEIVIPRYVVLTRLADSWIPRASHGDVDTAEAEAFRWRRIYGPGRTKVAEYLVAEADHAAERSPAPIQTLPSYPVALPRSLTMAVAPGIGWYDAAVRALTLYLGFGFANRTMELLIVLAQH